MMLKRFLFPLLAAHLAMVSLHYSPPAAASDYTLHRGALRLTYDPATIGTSESLGLLGLHALIYTGNYSYLGISGFGAVAGQRGGFLAGGYSAGLRLPLAEKAVVDLSLFLGGGGGGSAPQGGGLMVREQAGIDYLANGYQLGAGISRIRFPNGEIDSVQPYLSLQLPFTSVYASGWDAGELSPGTFSRPLYDHDTYFAISYKHYHGGSLFRSSPQTASAISLLGIEWQRSAGHGLYYTLSTHGTYQGGADGYAEVMAGGGMRWALARDTSVGLALALGSGGGGNVDTGGGALGAITLNLEQQLSRELYVAIQGGVTRAMEGQFGGTVLGISLGSHVTSPATTGGESDLATHPYAPARYRLRLIAQRYMAAPALYKNEPNGSEGIDLTGLQLDQQMGDHLYLTGQAMTAWRGAAGGYASGMMGGGVTLPLTRTFALKGELMAGAAGGGGIDVGDGLLLGCTLAANVHLNPALDLEMGTGRIAAYDGGLDTRQVTLAIAYRFSRPER